ncbi:hypothetical protein NQZ68_005657 [Dissostichus eleginoides]|nr:hypothetical protein NQZ68_005657 [Dissostichus eleginoides]
MVGDKLSACARIVPCLVWRGDPDTLPRACPDSGLNAWDERGTAVVRARAWPDHVAGLKTPVSRERSLSTEVTHCEWLFKQYREVLTAVPWRASSSYLPALEPEDSGTLQGSHLLRN